MFRINESMETENRLAIVYGLEIWGGGGGAYSFGEWWKDYKREVMAIQL